jgi:aryl-alcohol dehydrogenase-like predicted oxidoreductase
VQTEYSLATRDVDAEILPTCRELGIGFVAYAPLSRGLLTAEIQNLDQLADNDRRRDMPRFQGDNLDHNVAMVNAVAAIATAKQVSIADIALAWVLAQGNDIVALPGCARRKTLEDSLRAISVSLSADELAQIANTVDAAKIEGTRYPAKQMARLGI